MAPEPNVKLIAAVVHEVVTGHTFDDWAELVETVKTRCAQLHLPYDGRGVTDAVALVARTRAVLTPRRPAPLVERCPAVPPISRAEAASLWPRIIDAWRRRKAEAS